MRRLLDHYCRLLEGLSTLLLLVMVVLVFGNVVLRYAFNSGLTLSEEVSRWAFVWLTFMGAVVAVRDHGHLGTDVLVGHLPLRGKKACLVIGQLLMLYVTWLMFQGSLEQARLNLDVAAPVTGWSMACLYGAGVVFAVSSGLILLLQLWRTLSGAATEAELVMVQESEDLAQLQIHQPKP